MKENIFKCPKCNFKSKRNEWYNKFISHKKFNMLINGIDFLDIKDICPRCGTLIYKNGAVERGWWEDEV